MAGDLHTHSTCSDGSVPIHRLPLMAARLGLSALALSDHDTTLSAQYAYDHPVQDGVRLIPAAELTGYDFERSHRVHLLTFWPDLDCPALRRHCDIMRQRRNECALQSCREIEALYPQFRTEQALEYAQDSGVLFKSGIMQALQQLGLCDGIYTGLYHELFGWEPRGKCLHSPTYPPVREVLATAKAAGAVVVFAHPTVYKSMPLLRELVAEGAIDGIEVHHPRNSPEDMAECAELCKKHDLIVTGDLGQLGKEMLLELARRDGVSLGGKLTDCGTMVFDNDKQDVHAGGSGCGCSALTLCGYLLGQLNGGKLKKILFCGTGALLSPTSTQQGLPIPGVCHAVCIAGGT